jgi:hypothetical protein
MTPKPETPAKATGMRSIFRGNGMSVDAVFFWANWILIGALVLGVLATYAIVVSGNIRDRKLNLTLSERASDAAHANLKISVLDVRAKQLEADAAAANERAARLEKEASALKLEVAEANERTAKLELRQLGRFFAPDKFEKAIGDLKPFPVHIRFLENDDEGRGAAMFLFMCLQVAKWKDTPFPEAVIRPVGIPGSAFLGGFAGSITVKFNPAFMPGKKLADAIKASTPNSDVLFLVDAQNPMGEVTVAIAPRP